MHAICDYEHVQWIITAGSFVTIVIPMMLTFGISSQYERSSVMLKTLSCLFLLIEVISNGVFVFFNFSIPLYIILNGITILIYAMIAVSIYRTQK